MYQFTESIGKEGATIKYIAFMDLLGTKAIAISDPSKYRNVIKNFHSNIVGLQKKFDKDCPEINVFSDCAYLESEDVFQLCKFLKELRQKLLFQKICFNAAVCKGELQTNSIYMKKTKVSIIDFQNEKVVKVYGMQSRFSGAGIYVDPELMNDKNIKEKMMEITVSSIYKSINKADGKAEIFNCIDIKFGTNSLQLLIYILNLYIQCYILDRRASRYYYTLYATFIGEQSIDVFLNEDMRIIKEIMKAVKKIQVQEDENIIVMYLVNRLYNAQIDSLEFIDDLEVAHDYLDDALNYIYEEAKLDNLYNLKEIDSRIMSNGNKTLLAEFCFKKKISCEDK